MMDLLNEPVEKIARFVHSGTIELGEIPIKRRNAVKMAVGRLAGTAEADLDAVLELKDPGLEAAKAEVRVEVAAKKASTKKKRSKKSASKK